MHQRLTKKYDSHTPLTLRHLHLFFPTVFPEEENSLRETATLRLQQDIEREAQILAKRELRRGASLANQHHANNNNVHKPPDALQQKQTRVSKSSASSSSSSSDSDADPREEGGDVISGDTKAETRLRTMETGPQASMVAPQPFDTLAPTTSDPPATQSRLSRIQSTFVRNSLFVAHGNGPPLQRVGSFQPGTNGISPALLALTQNAMAQQKQEQLQQPQPQQPPASPPKPLSSTVPTPSPINTNLPASINNSSPSPLLSPPSSLSSPSLVLPSPALVRDPARLTSSPFNNIAEEEEPSVSRRSNASRSRRMSSAADRYSTNPPLLTSSPSLSALPVVGSPLDALVALKKSRDQSQSNLHPPNHIHTRTKTNGTMARLVAKMNSDDGPTVPPSSTRRLPNSGSMRETQLEDQVRTMEAKIAELTKQLAMMMTLITHLQRNITTVNGDDSPDRPMRKSSDPAQ